MQNIKVGEDDVSVNQVERWPVANGTGSDGRRTSKTEKVSVKLRASKPDGAQRTSAAQSFAQILGL